MSTTTLSPYAVLPFGSSPKTKRPNTTTSTSTSASLSSPSTSASLSSPSTGPSSSSVSKTASNSSQRSLPSRPLTERGRERPPRPYVDGNITSRTRIAEATVQNNKTAPCPSSKPARKKAAKEERLVGASLGLSALDCLESPSKIKTKKTEEEEKSITSEHKKEDSITVDETQNKSNNVTNQVNVVDDSAVKQDSIVDNSAVNQDNIANKDGHPPFPNRDAGPLPTVSEKKPKHAKKPSSHPHGVANVASTPHAFGVSLSPRLEAAFNELSTKLYLITTASTTSGEDRSAMSQGDHVDHNKKAPLFTAKPIWRPVTAQELTRPRTVRDLFHRTKPPHQMHGPNALKRPKNKEECVTVSPVKLPNSGPFDVQMKHDDVMSPTHGDTSMGLISASPTNSNNRVSMGLISTSPTNSNTRGSPSLERPSTVASSQSRAASPALTLLEDRFVFESKGLRIGRGGIEAMPLLDAQIPDCEMTLRELTLVHPLDNGHLEANLPTTPPLPTALSTTTAAIPNVATAGSTNAAVNSNNGGVIASSQGAIEGPRVWLATRREEGKEKKYVIKWYHVGNHYERRKLWRVLVVTTQLRSNSRLPRFLLPFATALLDPRRLRVGVVSPYFPLFNFYQLSRCQMPLALMSVAVRELLQALDWLHHTKNHTHNLLVPDRVAINTLRGEVLFLHLENCCGEDDPLWFQGGEEYPIRAYSAPERLLNLATSKAGDIWSVGLIVANLVSGKNPADYPEKAVSLLQLKERVASPDFLEGNAIEGLPPAVKEFVCCCCKRYPHLRPSTMELLEHEFIRGYSHVETSMLTTWLTTHATGRAQIQARLSEPEMSFHVSDGVRRKNLATNHTTAQPDKKRSATPPHTVAVKRDGGHDVRVKEAEENFLTRWFEGYLQVGMQTIGAQELTKMLSDLGEAVSLQSVQANINAIDTKTPGRLTKKEFIKAWNTSALIDKP